MMCRPLRAVMVGRRYAIIVPEDRSIRFGSRIADPSRSTLASPFFFSFPLLFPCVSPARSTGEEREKMRQVVSSGRASSPLTEGCYTHRRRSRVPFRRDWRRFLLLLLLDCTRSGRDRCRHMHSHCMTLTRGYCSENAPRGWSVHSFALRSSRSREKRIEPSHEPVTLASNPAAARFRALRDRKSRRRQERHG